MMSYWQARATTLGELNSSQWRVADAQELNAWLGRQRNFGVHSTFTGDAGGSYVIFAYIVVLRRDSHTRPTGHDVGDPYLLYLPRRQSGIASVKEASIVAPI